MRDAYISLVYLSFLVLGCAAPFVFSLGYAWVDNFYPQYLTDTLIHYLPVSLIMGVCAIAGYAMADRRAVPSISPVMVLTLVFALWATLTTTWAEAPDPAWGKWNWAFKTLVFSAFLPFTIRSRVQIEAFLQVWLFAAMAHLLPVGVKTLISGGGYGVQLGLLPSNTAGLSESSQVAAVSIMMIPLALTLGKHSVLVPPGRLRAGLYYAMALVFVFTAVGTFARTAIIGFAVLGANMWLRTRRKILFSVFAALLAGAVIYKSSQAWENRISTIETYDQDSSAYTRILVWQWTLGYVREHPFGGGFNVDHINRIEVPTPAGPVAEFGRSFHSIYFEILGEQGYLGIALFAAIVLLSMQTLWTTMRQTRGIASLAWCNDLAGALLTALLTLLACGSFISIGYQPLFWYLFAMAVSLRAWLARVTSGNPEGTPRRLVPEPAPRLAGLRQPGLASKPGALRPDALRPDALRPGVFRPGMFKPGALGPNAFEADRAGSPGTGPLLGRR